MTNYLFLSLIHIWADVSPYLYGEEPNAKLGTTDPIRDRFELATIKAALEANKPILGVCRGLQLLLSLIHI